MSTQHTPGPWYQHHETVQAPNGTLICTVANANNTANPNAKLIASAPDLLAALEELIDFEKLNPFDQSKAIKASRAAINKSRGEA